MFSDNCLPVIVDLEANFCGMIPDGGIGGCGDFEFGFSLIFRDGGIGNLQSGDTGWECGLHGDGSFEVEFSSNFDDDF